MVIINEATMIKFIVFQTPPRCWVLVIIIVILINFFVSKNSIFTTFVSKLEALCNHHNVGSNFDHYTIT